ncbi:hypothetical protein [Sinosporangium siamense]|uniref:hypothetical protein n=1 Tax=Sinosporangium siamense TaxID=1367973 RepID=UPI00195036B4|nr:hypothetical protein [Sinosporangium siamense]
MTRHTPRNTRSDHHPRRTRPHSPADPRTGGAPDALAADPEPESRSRSRLPSRPHRSARLPRTPLRTVPRRPGRGVHRGGPRCRAHLPLHTRAKPGGRLRHTRPARGQVRAGSRRIDRLGAPRPATRTRPAVHPARARSAPEVADDRRAPPGDTLRDPPLTPRHPRTPGFPRTGLP